jgi:regulator of nonsense transcripts 2
MYKTIEEAAIAVDEMFNLAFQSSGSTSFLQKPTLLHIHVVFAATPGEDSGEDSGDEGERPAEEEEEEAADSSSPESPVSSITRAHYVCAVLC